MAVVAKQAQLAQDSKPQVGVVHGEVHHDLRDEAHCSRFVAVVTPQPACQRWLGAGTKGRQFLWHTQVLELCHVPGREAEHHNTQRRTRNADRRNVAMAHGNVSATLLRRRPDKHPPPTLKQKQTNHHQPKKRPTPIHTGSTHVHTHTRTHAHTHAHA